MGLGNWGSVGFVRDPVVRCNKGMNDEWEGGFGKMAWVGGKGCVCVWDGGLVRELWHCECM